MLIRFFRQWRGSVYSVQDGAGGRKEKIHDFFLCKSKGELEQGAVIEKGL